MERYDESHQASDHGQVQGAGDAKSTGKSKTPRDTAQSFARIEFEILAGVDDVEAGGPEHNSSGQPQDSGIETAAHRNPGRCRCHSQAESKDEMGEKGEAF